MCACQQTFCWLVVSNPTAPTHVPGGTPIRRGDHRVPEGIDPAGVHCYQVPLTQPPLMPVVGVQVRVVAPPTRLIEKVSAPLASDAVNV